MNILFLLRGTTIGGLEVVTSVLANKFVEEGHKVYVFIFRRDNGASIVSKFRKEVFVCQKNDYRVTKDNVNSLRNILISNNVQFIINQWGLPLTPIRVAIKASSGLNVKIISVYHNAPSANGRIQSIDIKLAETENPLKKLCLKIARNLFKFVTSRSMAYIYNKSERYIVLSKGFIQEFKDFTHVKDLSKLRVITNPITISTDNYIFYPEKKQKEILYVGRLDFVQKRVYRVIDTWNYLEKKHLDWKLTIVGDGDDRKNLENHVKALGLKNVYFEGYQNPVEYYKRASLLMLTSDYEGFGLVIVEGMSYGVVPFVYGSYVAVHDIINNHENGIILEPTEHGFDAEQMASEIDKVINDNSLYIKLAQNAISTSKNFSLSNIYKQWNKELSTDQNPGGALNRLVPSFIFKEKEIIYVGRLDFVQKRVYRVIDTWNLLENKYPDWRLTIVGEGEDRKKLETHVKALNLKHVHFEGFQNPVPYYRRASILLLTSDFEGFPLVLAEAMSCGVVPVVYNSYAAVKDIIDHEVNGMITDKIHGKFCAESMAKNVKKVIHNCESSHSMAIQALKKSENYLIDSIYHVWVDFFANIR